MYIMRVALDDGGGKWAPGTVLGAYPANEKFNGGDMGSFYLFRITAPGYKLEDLKGWRLYKKFNLDQLMDATKKANLLTQKAQVQANNQAKITTAVTAITYKPDLTKSVLLNTLTVTDTGYKPPEPTLIAEVP